MGSSIFGIGLSGLNAAQAGLVTTGHNISNASTPGFNRQQVVQTANLPQAAGNGFYGQGVSVDTVRRLYSDALSGQLTQAQAQGSQIDAYNMQIQQLSSMFGDPSSGLAPALANFFGGVADVASHPESVPSRQSLLSSASTLTASFRDIDQQMAQMSANINSGVSSSVNAINSYAQQIAGLNQNILTVESSTQQPANDLRDQRDTLIAALNQVVRASVVKEDNGSYSIFIANGQPVVQGNRAFALTPTPSPEDPQHIVVGYTSGGSTATLADSTIQGGTLGGLLSFRSSSLDAARNALGRVAIGLAQSFNAQHALGQDLNGVPGRNFFSIAGPTVLTNAGNAVTATAMVSATVQDASALTGSDYRLQYNGAAGGDENFTLTTIPDGTTKSFSFASASGYPHSLNIDGVSLTLEAGATKNDSWLIEPTRFAAGTVGMALTDPAAIAVASPFRAQAAPSNASNATISPGSVSSLANMALPITLIFNSSTGQFDVTDASATVSHIIYLSGSQISVNGLSFAISGTPLNGDSFTLSRNTDGSADNRNALALGALQTINTMGRKGNNQPTTTFDGAYREVVSQIGNAARQANVSATAQTNVIAQAKQAQQSLSGVNLDEEAANLLRYQQAYQASGKMMQIASSLFQTVLDLGK